MTMSRREVLEQEKMETKDFIEVIKKELLRIEYLGYSFKDSLESAQQYLERVENDLDNLGDDE